MYDKNTTNILVFHLVIWQFSLFVSVLDEEFRLDQYVENPRKLNLSNIYVRRTKCFSSQRSGTSPIAL